MTTQESTNALVELALKALNCNQTQLAERLEVSAAQITKWKKGEHISAKMEKQLRELSGVADMAFPEVALWCGSAENARNWMSVIHREAENALDGAESGYDTPALYENLEQLTWETLSVLRKMGVSIPQEFPQELAAAMQDESAEIQFNPQTDGDEDEFWAKIESQDEDRESVYEENEIVCLIASVFKSFVDVSGFYSAYIQDLMFDDKIDILSTPAASLDDALLELAASKIEEPPLIAKNFSSFKRSIEKDCTEWINIIKEEAFRAGVPLRAELMYLVCSDHDSLGVDAERESMGLNKHQIHPDVYMNELLMGMRMIHQVLPKILEKLAIDFKVDISDLTALEPVDLADPQEGMKEA